MNMKLTLLAILSLLFLLGEPTTALRGGKDLKTQDVSDITIERENDPDRELPRGQEVAIDPNYPVEFDDDEDDEDEFDDDEFEDDEFEDDELDEFDDDEGDEDQDDGDGKRELYRCHRSRRCVRCRYSRRYGWIRRCCRGCGGGCRYYRC